MCLEHFEEAFPFFVLRRSARTSGATVSCRRTISPGLLLRDGAALQVARQ